MSLRAFAPSAASALAVSGVDLAYTRTFCWPGTALVPSFRSFSSEPEEGAEEEVKPVVEKKLPACNSVERENDLPVSYGDIAR